MPDKRIRDLDDGSSVVASTDVVEVDRAGLTETQRVTLAQAVTASGVVATAISTHEAASNPHPTYLTAAEGDAAYQPLDADLTTIAAANNGSVLAATTASFTTADETKLDALDADLTTMSVPASTTISAFGATLVDDVDAATARTTLGLVIGTDVAAPAETWTWRGVDTKTAAYTLVLADAGRLIEMDADADITIPDNASVAFPVGTQVGLLLANGHTGSVADAAGVTLNGEAAGSGSLAMTAHQIVVCTKLATDRWNVSGV